MPFLLPFTVIFVIFLFFPALYSIYLSFRKASLYSDLTNIFTTMKYVGFQNYIDLLHDRDFLWSLVMTTYYGILVVPPGIFVSLVLAALLSNRLPGHKIFRSAFFLPNVLDLFVVSIVWTAIYAPKLGVLDQLFHALKLPVLFKHGILADPVWALPGIALMVILKDSGFGMILYLAAIQNIPRDVYEAADIDGATAWQKFTKITFPLVKPVTLLLIVTGILRSLMAFPEIYALTQGRPFQEIPNWVPYFAGATLGMTKIAGYYLFEKFYLSYQYGYAAAMSVILLFISLPLSFLSFFALRTEGPSVGEMWRKWRRSRRGISMGNAEGESTSPFGEGLKPGEVG